MNKNYANIVDVYDSAFTKLFEQNPTHERLKCFIYYYQYLLEYIRIWDGFCTDWKMAYMMGFIRFMEHSSFDIHDPNSVIRTDVTKPPIYDKTMKYYENPLFMSDEYPEMPEFLKDVINIFDSVNQLYFKD